MLLTNSLKPDPDYSLIGTGKNGRMEFAATTTRSPSAGTGWIRATSDRVREGGLCAVVAASSLAQRGVRKQSVQCRVVSRCCQTRLAQKSRSATPRTSAPLPGFFGRGAARNERGEGRLRLSGRRRTCTAGDGLPGIPGATNHDHPDPALRRAPLPVLRASSVPPRWPGSGSPDPAPTPTGSSRPRRGSRFCRSPRPLP